MKWLILVNQGIESLAANELTAFGAKILEKNPACITIEISIEKIVMIAYKFQTINRILSFIASFSFTSIDDVEAKLDKIKINEITPSQTFAARSEQQKTEILSAEVQPLVGKIIAEKTKAKVNLSNPDVMIFTFINENKAYIGIDITGDISKRDYRIFLQRDKLKATIAYAALVFAEWHPHLSLIDPFCNTGIIPIEAALAATNTSPHFFKKEKFLFHKLPQFQKINPKKILEQEDGKITKPPAEIHAIDMSMNPVSAAKKNAKIAGVNKAIQFSRKEISWLDTKFEESSIDRIVSLIPQPSKNISEQQLGKIYHEFFYQCNYILKKNGKICLITKYPELLLQDAKRHNFKEEKRLEVTQGKETLMFILFSR